MTNADSLPNKMTELRFRINIMNKQPDVIAITEVVPKSRTYNVEPSDYHVDGYTAFTSDLVDKNRRGIVMLVKSDLNASHLVMDSTFSEMLWLKIRLDNNESQQREL